MDKIMMLISNSTLLAASICILVVAVKSLLEFISLPTQDKIAEMKIRLLEWVRRAEADLGSGTGSFKLAQVYDMFCTAYPDLKKWVSLNDFKEFVDDAINTMEDICSDDVTAAHALKLDKTA